MKELTEERYQELKQEVEETRQAAARAQGQLEQLTKRLQEEFECANVAEAKGLLATLQERRNKLEKSFIKELDLYERKWRS